MVEEVEHLELLELPDGRVDGLDLVLVEQQLLQVGSTRDVRLDLLDLVVRGLDLSYRRRERRSGNLCQHQTPRWVRHGRG